MSPSPMTMWAAILASGVITFALRGLFILRSSDRGDDRRTTTPPPWLQVIAPAALGALVLPALIRPEGTWAPFGPEAIAGLVATLVAWRTRSTIWTITVGFASLLLLRLL